jgi:alkanesulfonate monooxygenase SsuD/methylene tetrahydromethanopterin reductase-like flavin-dependent oxidoreductase (luciferase family)
VTSDRLGFDEFWVGEHYTTLSEPVTCPFTFLSNLIARTDHMKLGTGVVNLPQRHPVQTAAHAAMLDHLSDGRLILGVSPGGLVSDFEMFGVTDPQIRREMASESIETVLKLWSSEPPYDIRGKYWTLRLEDYHWPDLGVGSMIKPYQKPHPPLVASAMSPNSGSVLAAGLRGWGVISANFVPVSTIKTHWTGFAEGCAQSGRTPKPEDWRLARSIFVSEDDAEAKAYVRDPEGPFAHYFGYLVALIKRAAFHAIMKSGPEMADDDVTPEYACDSFTIAGDPDSVTEQLVALRDEVGPFGTILMTATDCLNDAHKARLLESMRLMAEEVMPRFKRAIGDEAAA